MNRTRLLLPLAAAAGSVLMALGCARSDAGPAPESRAAVTPASIYKAGRGLQFSAAAAQAVGLAAEDVASRDVASAPAVPAIPQDALLRTVKGDFVYVENGGWFLRTPVTVGASDGRWFEVKEGLYEGDRVVTRGTRSIWLAELQATNGGVGCADHN